MEKPAIRLEKLALRNYKGFYTGDDEKGIEITFDPNLTVFIGDNGAGKSAVLDAIALFLGKLREEISNVGEFSSIYSFTEHLPENGRTNKAVNNKVEETSIDGLFAITPIPIIDYARKTVPDGIETVAKRDASGSEIYINGILETIERQKYKTIEEPFERIPSVELSIYMDKLKAPKEITIREWKERNYQVTETLSIEDISDKGTLLKFLQDNIHDPFRGGEFRFEDRAIPILSYYGANSINTEVQGELEEVDTSLFDAYYNALDANTFSFKQFFAWYDNQQKKMVQNTWDKEEEKRTITNSKIEFISKAISMMLDEDKITYKNLRIDWSEYPNEMKIIKEDKTTDEKYNLSVSQLSSGERTLIALVADLTRRLCLANPNSDNPLEGNGIVLIDEIDVHLHPKWQQKVVNKLRSIFPNVQFIVTTHSPLVLTHLPDNHFKVYRLTGKGVERFDKVRGMRLIEIFYNLYDTPARPKNTQEVIDNLFEAIDAEDIKKARTLLDKLNKNLPNNDPAIIEAETSLKYIS